MAEAFRSPIVTAAAHGTGVTLRDETGLSLARRFEGTVAPGTSRRKGDRIEWSVSPQEWTVAGPDPGDDDVDLTHVRAVFRLSGENALGVLAKVCWLDLADDMFPDGAAARTSIADVAAELVRDDRDGVRSFLLLPSRSFAGYLWEVLVDAGAEFGLPSGRARA